VPIVLDGEEFLTIPEAAEAAQRSEDTIRRWIEEHLVEAHQDRSRRWLVKRPSLDAYLRGDPRVGQSDTPS